MMYFEEASMISEISKKHAEIVEKKIIEKLNAIGRELHKATSHYPIDDTRSNLEERDKKQRIAVCLIDLEFVEKNAFQNARLLKELKTLGVNIRFEHQQQSFETLNQSGRFGVMYKLPAVIVEITEELGRK